MKPSKDDLFRAEISMISKAGKISNSSLADRLGCSQATFYRKLREPNTFTLLEIRSLKTIAKGLGLEVQLL